MVTPCSRQLAQCLPNEVEWMERSWNRRQEVRVLLVDHSELALHGLKATLSTFRHIVVVGTATTQEKAMASLKTCEVDVVVMDIQVGYSSGVEICRAIRESDPQVAVLFFTANDDRRLLRSAILAGAQGYLLKKASSEAIAKAIETVAARRAIVDQHLIQDILQMDASSHEPSPTQSSEESFGIGYASAVAHRRGKEQQRDGLSVERDAWRSESKTSRNLQTTEYLEAI